MQARALGRSGLYVSSLALGTMTWGRDTDIHEARDQLTAFAQAGGNLVDTADVYADGAAEEMLGDLLAEHPSMLVSSKAGSVRPPRRRDASRGHLLGSLDASLRRLRRSHIDVWHVHGWDAHTPTEETLSAVERAVESGRVRYAGVSNFAGWQVAAFSASPYVVSAQMEYSLLQRGIEREVAPACDSLGLGILAWSPLGRGVLTGKYRHSTPSDSRAASTHFASFVQPYLADRPRSIVEAVATAADGLGAQPSHVALAWLLGGTGITSAIVGARTATQLRAVLPAADTVLPQEIIEALDEVSRPERGYPEWGWNQT